MGHKKITLDAAKKQPELVMRGEKDLQQESSMVVAASCVEVNRNIHDISVTTLPSIHSMINSAYSVISQELRRLDFQARASALSTNQIRNFERLTASTVRLANLEMNIRESSELEIMSDEKVKELVSTVMERERKAEVDR